MFISVFTKLGKSYALDSVVVFRKELEFLLRATDSIVVSWSIELPTVLQLLVFFVTLGTTLFVDLNIYYIVSL